MKNQKEELVFIKTASGRISSVIESKKIHPVLDEELLYKSCPCCGSPDLHKDELNYTCFRCGTAFPLGFNK